MKGFCCSMQTIKLSLQKSMRHDVSRWKLSVNLFSFAPLLLVSKVYAATLATDFQKRKPNLLLAYLHCLWWKSFLLNNSKQLAHETNIRFEINVFCWFCNNLAFISSAYLVCVTRFTTLEKFKVIIDFMKVYLA